MMKIIVRVSEMQILKSRPNRSNRTVQCSVLHLNRSVQTVQRSVYCSNRSVQTVQHSVHRSNHSVQTIQRSTGVVVHFRVCTTWVNGFYNLNLYYVWNLIFCGLMDIEKKIVFQYIHV